MSTEREIFSRNLKRLIENSYLNQSDLAAIVGVSKGSFSDWVNARSYPRPAKLAALAKALGVTEYDLITDFGSTEKRQFMSKELEEIARELHENPDARALFTAISKLSEADRKAIEHLVFARTNRD